MPNRAITLPIGDASPLGQDQTAPSRPRPAATPWLRPEVACQRSAGSSSARLPLVAVNQIGRGTSQGIDETVYGSEGPLVRTFLYSFEAGASRPVARVLAPLRAAPRPTADTVE